MSLDRSIFILYSQLMKKITTMEDCFFLLSLLLVSYISLVSILKVVVHQWWRPKRTENHFMKQGIKGPKYQPFLGNLKELESLNLMASDESMNLSHDILPRVLSFYHHWKKIYGPMFLVWFGTTPRLTICDPTLIKEIFFSKSDYFEKIESPLLVRKIEGDGLLSLEGEKWAHHRRIIQPIFHTENLKLMMPVMAKSMEEALAKLSEKMSNLGQVEIEASEWFQNLVEDVITRATFGSSYEHGRAIFQLQAHHMAHATQAYHKVFVPGYWFLPTKNNRISWRYEKQIRESMLNLIDQRQKMMKNPTIQAATDECPNDLLELMIKAHDDKLLSSNPTLVITKNNIIEECKTIFFAGKQTTSNLLTWTMVLMAMHPQWQAAAREEVLRVCESHDIPTKDDLAKLKMLGMILNESLRLYPPAVAMIRRAKTNVQLGALHIPQGTELLIPILAVHHDPSLWSGDAQEFNPARFATGAACAANHQLAFLPFGLGARRCIGQNLAVLQAKLAIAMILRHFSFELAPNYQHAPSVLMLLHPQHGAPIVVRKFIG